MNITTSWQIINQETVEKIIGKKACRLNKFEANILYMIDNYIEDNRMHKELFLSCQE